MEVIRMVAEVMHFAQTAAAEAAELVAELLEAALAAPDQMV